MTEIERLARAVAAKDCRPEVFDFHWAAYGDRYKEATAAILQALREPSEEMVEAGYDATREADGMPQFARSGFCLGHAVKIYRAMIDAAIGGK